MLKSKIKKVEFSLQQDQLNKINLLIKVIKNNGIHCSKSQMVTFIIKYLAGIDSQFINDLLYSYMDITKQKKNKKLALRVSINNELLKLFNQILDDSHVPFKTSLSGLLRASIVYLSFYPKEDFIILYKRLI